MHCVWRDVQSASSAPERCRGCRAAEQRVRPLGAAARPDLPARTAHRHESRLHARRRPVHAATIHAQRRRSDPRTCVCVHERERVFFDSLPTHQLAHARHSVSLLSLSLSLCISRRDSMSSMTHQCSLCDGDSSSSSSLIATVMTSLLRSPPLQTARSSNRTTCLLATPTHACLRCTRATVGRVAARARQQQARQCDARHH